MKIKKINVQNYRLLKDFSLELKSELSLIVGKNNCGKTSVLSVLEKIINKSSSLTWEDINLYHRKVIFENIKKDVRENIFFCLYYQLFLKLNVICAFTSFVILINGPTCTVIGFAVSCKLYAHSNVIVPPGCTSANDGCASITSGIIVATLHCMEF